MTAALDGFDPRAARVHLAVLQPSPFCNIDCKYCYLPDRSVSSRMSPQVLRDSFRFLLEQPDRLAPNFVIAWHSGEPLALPLEFYERAFDLLAFLTPRSIKVENSIQTNATLIDQRWCDFIKQRKVSLGVSVDGPQWIHDLRRVDRAGRGTFERVLRGIELLKLNNIEFSTIGVLSSESLQFPDEIWRFYKDLGVRSLAFNLEDVEGVHRVSSLTSQDSFRQVESFFRRLLQLRNQEDPGVYIRELDYFFNGLPDWHTEFRTMENLPLCIIAIDWQGNISTFSPELLGMKHPRYGDFVIGNVATDTLNSILTSPKFSAIYRDVAEGIRQCKATCEYFCVCGGGTPSTKLHQNGTFDSAETLACQLRIKAIGNVVLDFLEKKHCVAGGPNQSVKQRVNSLLPLVDPIRSGTVAGR
jgi:uncharacterized protein